jgi:hypothetical protein
MDKAGELGLRFNGEIVEGQHSDQAPLGHHRQTVHPVFPQQTVRSSGVGASVDGHRVRSHDRGHLGLVRQSAGKASDDEVPLSHDPDQFSGIADRDGVDLVHDHHSGGMEKIRVRPDDDQGAASNIDGAHHRSC